MDEKYSLNIEVSYEESEKSFFILEDNTPINNKEILYNYIRSKGYNLKVLDIKKLVSLLLPQLTKLKPFNDDICFIGVGDGGKRVLMEIVKQINYKINCKFIKWSRVIKDGQIIGYNEDNLKKYELSRKKVVLVDDVISSGNTMELLIRRLGSNNVNLLAIVSTVMYGNRVQDINSKLIISCLINTTEYNDSIYYPPLYSTRHILYGEGDKKKFYSQLSEIYFNNDLKFLSIIKNIRCVNN